MYPRMTEKKQCGLKERCRFGTREFQLYSEF